MWIWKEIFVGWKVVGISEGIILKNNFALLGSSTPWKCCLTCSVSDAVLSSSLSVSCTCDHSPTVRVSHLYFLCARVQCLVAGLDGCWDLLPSWSGLGGEPPGVPAGLLVHKPGVSSPNQQVEEAKHLEEQQNHPSLLVKTHKNPSLPSPCPSFSPQRCWGFSGWQTPWPRRWRWSPRTERAWMRCPRCPWRPSRSAGPWPRRRNTPARGRPGSPWPGSPGKPVWVGQKLQTLQNRRSSTVDTHKNRAEVRVFVDVHVAQIHQQSHHAVEEADGGHAHEELRRGGGVSHQVCGRDRTVADGGVSCNQRDVG